MDSLSPTNRGPEGEEGETAAERRRRLAALGQGDEDESDSDEDGRERQPRKGHQPVEEPLRSPGIRFANAPETGPGRVQWQEDVGRPSKRK